MNWILIINILDCLASIKWIGEECNKSGRPDLSLAQIVVSGGRALKSQENFKLLYQLADVLGGAAGRN